MLRRELEIDLAERGIGEETIRLILDIVGNDTVVLSSLVRTIRTSSDVPNPGESIRITAMFFLVVALPVLVPFFVASGVGMGPLLPAVVAFGLASFSISTAGLFTAVL